jgi:hypothetical protein
VDDVSSETDGTSQFDPHAVEDASAAAVVCMLGATVAIATKPWSNVFMAWKRNKARWPWQAQKLTGEWEMELPG